MDGGDHLVARRTSRGSITIAQINMRLAHPEGLTDSAAQATRARRQSASSTSAADCTRREIAGSQHTPQLAYELLSRANEPEMKEILDNVVFFLWPTINPDGQDIVVNGAAARRVRPAAGRRWSCTRSTSATTTTATRT